MRWTPVGGEHVDPVLAGGPGPEPRPSDRTGTNVNAPSRSPAFERARIDPFELVVGMQAPDPHVLRRDIGRERDAERDDRFVVAAPRAAIATVRWLGAVLDQSSRNRGSATAPGFWRRGDAGSPGRPRRRVTSIDRLHLVPSSVAVRRSRPPVRAVGAVGSGRRWTGSAADVAAAPATDGGGAPEGSLELPTA